MFRYYKEEENEVNLQKQIQILCFFIVRSN